MKVYCIPNCEECNQVKEKYSSKVDIVELEFVDGKYCEKTENGYIDVKYHAFPVLYIGETDGNRCALIGYEGISNYLDKGFVHTIKMCPFSQSSCKEKECEMFSILMNGMIAEGNCSLKWLPILSTEIISIAKRGK